jgi:mRNA-degrading endonuclease toxin of MazEF toxin-antitoxin module
VRMAGDKARRAVVVRSDLLSELSYATVLPITTELGIGIKMRTRVLGAIRVSSQEARNGGKEISCRLW